MGAEQIQQAVINGYRLKIETLESMLRGEQSEAARLREENRKLKASLKRKEA